MSDILTKAVEAGARGLLRERLRLFYCDEPEQAEPAAADTEARDRPDWRRAKRDAEAALRAALPGILEAVVGVARDKCTEMYTEEDSVRNSAFAEVFDDQNALVAQILEGK
jgi:hypothetical protein